jgi:purine-nucleoside phosphorylase
VIAARHCGLEVLGISCVTNYAAGIKPEARATHEEVLEVTKQREQDLAKLLRALLPKL